MFSRSESSTAADIPATDIPATDIPAADIPATTITIKQLGERHKELVRAANTRRHRSPNHEWTQGELTELSLAYLCYRETTSLHEIAQDINAHFAEYLIRQDREEESDDDVPLVGPEAASEQAQNEFREGLPSVNAIEMKLIDCAALYMKCENAKLQFGAKPSAMHVEVWQHLLQAQKHREMIRTMKSAIPAPAPARAPTPVSSRLGKVHRRKESECDRADFPSAKRRKLNPEDDDSNSREKFMEMQEMCKALDAIASQVEEREQNRLHANAAIAQSLATIRQNKQDIELLTGYIQDTQSGINKCVERIDAELAKIETILHHAAPATPAPAPAVCCMTSRIDDEDDNEHDEEHDYYNVDGHDISAWIYNESYDEPQRGDYDHAEECS
jgi:hypothetical protein